MRSLSHIVNHGCCLAKNTNLDIILAANLFTKAVGAALALEFASVCAYKGATVCEPFGDFSPYDLLLDVPGNGFFRIQVKSATLKKNGKYSYNAQPRLPCVGNNGTLTSKAVPYPQGVIDALVSKVQSHWYIHTDVHNLPATIEINPGNPGKYALAMENWTSIGL